MDRALASPANSKPTVPFDRDAFHSQDPEVDPCAAAPDLEFVAEPEEIEDLDWRLTTVDILDMYKLSELDDLRELPRETNEEAAERWRSVRDWIAAEGGPEKAFEVSPVIAIVDDGAMTPIDGWHRCVVAWLDYGIRDVNALVGAPRNELTSSMTP